MLLKILEQLMKNVKLNASKNISLNKNIMIIRQTVISNCQGFMNDYIVIYLQTKG